MKKILFITGEFIPHTPSVGGVIRVVSFIKSLKKNKIKLISLKKKKHGFLGFKNFISHVEKIYINLGSIEENSSYNIFIKALKRLFSNIFYVLGIDSHFFYISKYNKKIITEMNLFKPDFVIISGPPFSLFRLVKKIKKNFGYCKIILDYRDGWTLRVDSLFALPFKIPMINYEKKILNEADFILCATAKIFQGLKSISKKNKIILLTNGYFIENKKKIKKKKSFGKIKIGYFGLISDNSNSFRDLNIIHRSLIDKNKLFFTFYGNSVINKNEIKNCKNFKFKKNISYFKALSKMREFDYLLILHTEKSTSKEVVTGKFYEYVSSGIPIILISNGETEAGKLIKRYNLGYVLDYSKGSLSDFLSKIENKSINFKPYKNLTKFSRNEQNKKLLKIIN